MHAWTLFGLALATGAVVADYLNADGRDVNGNPLPEYSPGRPPSIPLAVRSPYLSAWSTTSTSSTLNTNSVWFWSGVPLGWEGMVTVDGTTYEYLGIGALSLQRISSLKSALPKTVTYDSQYSNFTFLAGPVEITASFFSPVTPKDICRTSIPMSYLTTSVRSLDNRTHDVQFYSDVNDAWIRRRRESPLIWNLVRDGPPGTNGTNSTSGTNTASEPDEANSTAPLYSWILYQDVHYFMAEDEDMAQWGNFTYTTSTFGARNFTYESGDGVSLRYTYVAQRTLANTVETSFDGLAGRESIFAFSHDFGNIREASVRYTIGSLQTPAARYLYSGGVAQLAPWWQKCYGTMADLIRFHWNDFSTVQGLAASFEESLQTDINKFYGTNETFGYTARGETTDRSGINGMPNTAGAANRNSQGQPNTAESPVYQNSSLPAAALHRRVDEDMAVNGSGYIFDPDTEYGYLDAQHNSTGVAIPDVSEPRSYYAILALSARQVMGAYIYTVPPDAPAADCASPGHPLREAPLVFQKEVSSDGNLNTIDVIYPVSPFFLWANPEMLRYLLQPGLELHEGTFYPNTYCAHDIGASFPNATGHVDGNDEYMPVEESGDFLLMAYALYRFTNNTGWLRDHYRLMAQFAEYLVDTTLVPAAQLSTDDFAGTLANQTNLAIKGILGLQAMARIAQLVGERQDGLRYAGLAQQYYARWTALAIDPSRQHALLAYQWRSSWGLLYNIYMDKLLGLGLVGDDVYAMQSDWYAQVSQVFGVPLDSRHHYTKSDWMLWAAAASRPRTRRLLVTSLAYWLNFTGTEHPFADLYEVVGGGYYPRVPQDIRFKARPVVGGHFALLALLRAGQLAGAVGANTTGSHLDTGGTNALTSEVALPTAASVNLGGSSSGAAPPVPNVFATSVLASGSDTFTGLATPTGGSTPSVSQGAPSSETGLGLKKREVNW